MKKIPIEYALLRYQHSESAGELVNVGVIAFCATEERLLISIPARSERLARFIANFDSAAFEATVFHLAEALESKFNSLTTAGLGKMTLSQILPKLVAENHNSLLWSKVRSGVCRDLSKRLAQLTEEFVFADRPKAPMIVQAVPACVEKELPQPGEVPQPSIKRANPSPKRMSRYQLFLGEKLATDSMACFEKMLDFTSVDWAVQALHSSLVVPNKEEPSAEEAAYAESA